MAELSERGRGIYYFIDEPERIRKALVRELYPTRNLVARDVSLTVELHPAVEVIDIFANSYQHHGNQIHVQGGDLSSGELRRIQIRLRLPKLMEGKHDMGLVRIEYLQPVASTMFIERSLALTYGSYGPSIEQSRNREVSKRASTFEAHYARSRAAKAVDGGNINRAKQILTENNRRLREFPVQSDAIVCELDANKAYGESLDRQHTPKDRARVQKAVKYKSYTLEGC